MLARVSAFVGCLSEVDEVLHEAWGVSPYIEGAEEAVSRSLVLSCVCSLWQLGRLEPTV